MKGGLFKGGLFERGFIQGGLIRKGVYSKGGLFKGAYLRIYGTHSFTCRLSRVANRFHRPWKSLFYLLSLSSFQAKLNMLEVFSIPMCLWIEVKI